MLTEVVYLLSCDREVTWIFGKRPFLGSYALHTDPIVRGNLVSVSVCHFEDEKTRDTKTSGR